jgi:acyl dehydratase
MPNADAPFDPATIDTLIHGRTWEEMTPGFTFRTNGRTVTEADLVAFVTLVGANEPLFFDAQFALDHGYSGQLSGMLTFSYAEGLVLRPDRSTAPAWPAHRLDVKGPVYVGDTITVVVEVTELGERVGSNRGLVRTQHRVQREGGDGLLAAAADQGPRRWLRRSASATPTRWPSGFRHHFQDRVPFNRARGVPHHPLGRRRRDLRTGMRRPLRPPGRLPRRRRLGADRRRARQR